MSFIPVMAKLEFLQSSVSHDHSENILICLLLLSMLKTIVLLNMFVENVIHFFRIFLYIKFE